MHQLWIQRWLLLSRLALLCRPSRALYPYRWLPRAYSSHRDGDVSVPQRDESEATYALLVFPDLDTYTVKSVPGERSDVMPSFRRLNSDEVAAMRARRRGSVDLTEYSEFIRALQVGEGGEVTLGQNEQKRTVKRRLTRAARQMDKDVRYRRSEGNMIRFEVRSLSGN